MPFATAAIALALLAIGLLLWRGLSADDRQRAVRGLWRGGVLAVILIGLSLVVYYWLVYDATVQAGSEFGSERVYNVGRMQDRLIGLVVGFGALAVGLTLAIGSALRKR